MNKTILLILFPLTLTSCSHSSKLDLSKCNKQIYSSIETFNCKGKYYIILNGKVIKLKSSLIFAAKLDEDFIFVEEYDKGYVTGSLYSNAKGAFLWKNKDMKNGFNNIQRFDKNNFLGRSGDSIMYSQYLIRIKDGNLTNY